MTKGEHWIIDIYDFPNIRHEFVLEILKRTIKIVGATLVHSDSGETKVEKWAFVMIDESHIAVHDFKNGRAALDIFTCGGKDMIIGFNYIKENIGFKNYKIPIKIKRFGNG